MSKEKIVLYGAGERCEVLLKTCEFLDMFEILEIWDINSNLYDANKKICQPHSGFCCEKIVVTPRNSFDEISNFLTQNLGYNENLIVQDDYILNNIKKMILKKYKNNKDVEICQILKYLNNNNLDYYNYEFTKNYSLNNLEIYFDEKHLMYFYFWQNKKMYLSKKYSSELKAKTYINRILLEQDTASPHYYNSKFIENHDGGILIDAGAAEGVFALSHVDSVDKLYVIESDSDWIEALKITFKDYSHKVKIIHKTLDNKDSGTSIKLDTLLNGESINIFKIDTEGAEQNILLGAENSIKNSKNFMGFICAYHTQYDEKFIRGFFDEKHFEIITNGYICYYNDAEDIDLRRCVLNIIRVQ